VTSAYTSGYFRFCFQKLKCSIVRAFTLDLQPLIFLKKYNKYNYTKFLFC